MFTELLAMAEDSFGEEAVDRVIEALDLPSGGAYTSVGNYPCEELFNLIGGFSANSGLSAAALQRLFGHWMMQSFARHYPQFFEGREGSLDMLEAIEDDIHVEVRKLYPDADLPTFNTRRDGPGRLDMTYRSPRALAEFCHGLIESCTDHFGESACVSRRDRSEDGRTVATFRIHIRRDA
ncbi:heme NO-binding domain-containing protein [Roseinatronobacter monicus]|nr:heme NO-binding domain-containing protein [Roseinatronobacter monicus]